MESGSCTSTSTEGGGGGGGGGKRASVKKKRPQSLFVSRAGHNNSNSNNSSNGSNNKPHKASSAGCVDKSDPSSRGGRGGGGGTTFVVGSPPTPTATPTTSRGPSLSSQSAASDSSLNTQDSCLSLDNLQPADREARYRLDYTNLHVDTDLESLCTDDRGSLDSRRGSSVYSGEGGGRFQLGPARGGAGWRDEGDAGSSESGDVGLGMLDCDPSSFIFPQVSVCRCQVSDRSVTGHRSVSVTGRCRLEVGVGVRSVLVSACTDHT